MGVNPANPDAQSLAGLTSLVRRQGVRLGSSGEALRGAPYSTNELISSRYPTATPGPPFKIRCFGMSVHKIQFNCSQGSGRMTGCVSMAWSRMRILENLRTPNICCLQSGLPMFQFFSSGAKEGPASHDTELPSGAVVVDGTPSIAALAKR